MNFCRVFYVDLLRGVLRGRYLLGVIPAVLNLIILWSAADVQNYALAGLPLHSGITILPPLWLLFCIMFFLMNLTYAKDALTGFGSQLFVRSGSRKCWWLSKCLWTLCTAILYTVLFNLYLVLGRILSGTEALSFAYHFSFFQLCFLLIVLPTLSLAVFSLGQTVMSLFLPEAVSFYLTIVALIVMGFCDGIFLPVQGLMILRSGLISEGGYMPSEILASDILWFVILFLTGLILIKKKAVTGKDSER